MNTTTAKALPRYRTVQQARAYIKEMDNETAITEFFIRTKCMSKQVDSFPTGKKLLVNLDSLLRFLNPENEV